MFSVMAQDSSDNTTYYLEEWQDKKNAQALDQLLARHMSRIRQMVEKRLGPALRRKVEAGDMVNEAVREFLEYGPPFRIDNGRHFRSLMVRIVGNVIRDCSNRFQAIRRDMKRELAGDASVVIDFNSEPQRADDTPDAKAADKEDQNRIRLALELMPPRERLLIVSHKIEGLSWDEIATDQDFPSAAAARMACKRAIRTLRQFVKRITDRDIDGLLDDAESADRQE